MTLRVLFAILVTQVALGLGPAARPGRMPERLRNLLQPGPGHVPVRIAGFEGEFMIDTSVVQGGSAGNEWSPDAATDGTQWFVVWSRERSGVAGARFSAGGEPIDTVPLRLGSDSTDAARPRVAFNGTDFLVTWVNQNVGQVEFARVTPGGVLRDSAPIPIGSARASVATTASAGDTSLVAWSDYGARDGDIYAARVRSDGTVLDPGGFVVTDDSADEADPEVAWGTGGFLVTWVRAVYDTISYEQDVFAARVSLGGQVLDTVPIPVADKQGWTERGPSVAFTNGRYLVAWAKDTVYDFTPRVECRRLTVGGVIIDTALLELPVPGPTYRVAATADSVNFLIAWETNDTLTGESRVVGVRLSADGQILDSAVLYLSASGHPAWSPRVTTGPRAFLGVWEDWSSISGDIVAARVSPAGVVLDTPAVLLTTGADEQRCPRAAACSTNALVAWLEQRAQGHTLHAGRVSPTGTVLDPSGIEVSAEPCLQPQPGLAYGAGEYLLAWTGLEPDRISLFAARVTVDGLLLDTAGIPVCTTGAFLPVSPDVAFDGANFLITWSSTDSMGMSWTIRGARLTPGGTVLDPDPLLIADEDPMDLMSCAVFNGQDYVVTWAALDTTTYESDIKFKRLRPDGVLLDSAPRMLTDAAYDQLNQSGAASGETTLFAWTDNRSGTDYDIYCARVSRDGRVLDPNGRLVSSEGPFDDYPGVVWDGAGYYVFWRLSDYDSAAVAGAQLRPDGSVIRRFTAARAAAEFVSPAAFPTGELLVTWDGYAGMYLGRNYDCRRIWGKMGPFLALTEDAASRSGTGRLPTLVRGMLHLPRSSGRTDNLSLLDISGRHVMALQPGLNDVRRLAHGVYFIRNRTPGAEDITRVVVLR